MVTRLPGTQSRTLASTTTKFKDKDAINTTCSLLCLTGPLTLHTLSVAGASWQEEIEQDGTKDAGQAEEKEPDEQQSEFLEVACAPLEVAGAPLEVAGAPLDVASAPDTDPGNDECAQLEP